MAYLLGNKFCIDSLQKDVGDLQAIIIDIFSRTGSVAFPSWKYPDKVSCDIDINEMLDRYVYSDNEEDCQVSHVILLELVIDRLVLVIQSFSRYMEQMLLMGKASSNLSSSNTSVGLVVKKYWNKMVHLHSVVQQLQSENRSKSNKMTELQDMVESYSNLGSQSIVTDDVEDVQYWASPVVRKSTAVLSISADTNCKSSQTYETAFIPCEACDSTQFCLREAGQSISDTCKVLTLPSKISKSVEKYRDSWMSVQDLRIWLMDQQKDLEGIASQMTTLSAKASDLERQLENSRTQCSKLQSDLKKSKLEVSQQKENMTVTRKQYEKKLQDGRDKYNEAVAEFERKNGVLHKSKEALEVNVADLKCQLDLQVEALKNLEESQRRLVEDLHVNRTNQQEVKKSQKYVEIVEKELKTLHGKLEECSRTLAREEAMNRSSTKQIEALRNKQAQLSDQVESLEQENEDLKREIADLETEKDSLSETVETSASEFIAVESRCSDFKAKIDEMTKEKNELSKRVRDLEEQVVNFEIKVQKGKEQERLLIEYPDLNGPINTDFEGTGDVALDMENQIKANSVRINILTEENSHLRHSVRKIMEADSRNNARTCTPRRSGAGTDNTRPFQNNTNDNPSSVPKLQLWH